MRLEGITQLTNKIIRLPNKPTVSMCVGKTAYVTQVAPAVTPTVLTSIHISTPELFYNPGFVN